MATLQIFGELVFNRTVMREKLNQVVFDRLMNVMQSGGNMDTSLAADVAHAMKDWAISKGATHFTHWFQPQRGGTAEKHDAFINYAADGDIIESFSAKELIQSEPDASSFPSGGIRSTFEARGYTAWDPTSPAFLIDSGTDRTLVIPSVYLSWTGEVLDLKTPFLRSMRALNDAAVRLQRLLGNRPAKKIVVNAGPEQEYFIVARRFYDTRPDLRVCGRTLFGARLVKGQQMADHYFGAIDPRIIAFMADLDRELYRRGIPSKTRHNEVSPNQFEVAPLFEPANMAIDHNLQMLDIMRNVARKHDLVVLLHEKPFAGVNGSGKHLNWSIGDNTSDNYLEPSASPLKNITFLLTLGAMLLGLDQHGGLLRTAVADAGNDHRLGANEAPPAIMSLYLGDYLSRLLDDIEGISKLTESDMAHINMGVRNLPRIARDCSDRNRTAPLAFTGNKFEFRAPGASQNPSEGVTLLNLLMAYGFHGLYTRLSAWKGAADIKEKAVLVLRDVFRQTKRVRFEGNAYSAEWHREAAQRGLPNTPDTPSALPAWLTPEVIELYAKAHVLSDRELQAKYEIKLENYNKTLEIEFRMALQMVRTLLLPALIRQLTRLAEATAALAAIGVGNESLSEETRSLAALYDSIKAAATDLETIVMEALATADQRVKADLLAHRGISALAALRHNVDHAETLVARDIWPMATYQELLTEL